MEEFGASRAYQAVKNTKKSNAAFKWKELYKTKLEDVNKKEKKAAERLKSAEVPSSSRTSKRSGNRSRNTLGLAAKMYPSEKKESLNMKKAKSYSSKKDSTTFKRSTIVSEDYAPNSDYHKTGNSRACLIA
ncbi:uncharacterized protein [Pyrus communis]|uniref:uncharacterized protein n=1 Tax=Pyrus communis TaxID=23211 RepID=UPI0035BFFD7B